MNRYSTGKAFVFFLFVAAVLSGCKTNDAVTPPCPKVISTVPAKGAMGVLPDVVLITTLDQKVNPYIVTPATLTLYQGTVELPGKLTYDGATSTLTFVPDTTLQINATYTVKLGTSVKDPGGHDISCNDQWNFTTNSSTGGPVGVNLGIAARFGILAGLAITSQSDNNAIDNQDVGISPGLRASVTGFTDGTVVNGTLLASDDASADTKTLLSQAKSDLSDAYVLLAASTFPVPEPIDADAGGTTLNAGIYKANTFTIANGNLTLDGQGNPDAVWIFQIDESLTTDGTLGGNVFLRNGAKADNVFWQVGSAVVIGDSTTFQGNILSLTGVTINPGATVQGRVLVKNGGVLLTSSDIISR